MILPRVNVIHLLSDKERPLSHYNIISPLLLYFWSFDHFVSSLNMKIQVYVDCKTIFQPSFNVPLFYCCNLPCILCLCSKFKIVYFLSSISFFFSLADLKLTRSCSLLRPYNSYLWRKLYPLIDFSPLFCWLFFLSICSFLLVGSCS